MHELTVNGHNPVRIGVDTGGTFTDCVMVEGSEVRVLKVFSTPDDPARGIVEGVQELLKSETSPACLPSRAAPGAPRPKPAYVNLEVVHGTTVGTNTLLERKGARVALVSTAGFEDLIELGRQNRPRLYDLAVRREPPLVPRSLRFGVPERTAAGGSILKAPSRADLRHLVSRLLKSGAESLALCFLFSYANPSNEQAVAQALGTLGLPLSVSHEILPEFREYERTSTVLINAYLAPRLGAYLARLAGAFGADKTSRAGSRISVMQSSGGIATAERAAREPVRTILSGPAGGVVAAARLAERLGVRRAISFDMGGTSTDVSLIDGAPRTTRETTLGGLPVAVPVLDVHSVGAGGGSLARIDAGGALRVGPESAGAVPGPACYGRGGDKPTVTDAHLVLGRLDAEHFLGNAYRLELKAALNAFAGFLQEAHERVTKRLLPKTPLDLARGIVAVANATMERALRVVSVERGHDPRDFALVCFGGAGGLHAADLARALGISQVIVPANPGAFSALGVVLSDIIKDASQSVLLPVPSDPGQTANRFLKEIEARFDRLERAARNELRDEGFGGPISIERHLDLRYVGQSYELAVPFSADFRDSFHREHERAYGHAQAGRQMEIVNLRSRLLIKTPKPESVHHAPQPAAQKPARSAIIKNKPVWFENRMWDTTLYDRAKLAAGNGFRGPAVVLEYSSTTVVPPDYQCRVDREGNLMMTRLAE